MKHSEVAVKLAIDGAVSAIAGTVKGELGLRPRLLGPQEKADLGMADVGETLFYEVGDGGVDFHTDGAFTTIWYAGGDYTKGIDALDAAIKRKFPDASAPRTKITPPSAGFVCAPMTSVFPTTSWRSWMRSIRPAGRTSKIS